MYRAIDIVNKFIEIDEKEHTKEKLSLLKAMKLLYYAEGCSLASGNGSLFSEKIVAWGHGPAVIEVYGFYKDPYNLKITTDQNYEYSKIEDKDNELLNQVYQVFGKNYTAWQLREKTRIEKPWIEASRNGTYFKNPEIERDKIEEYFRLKYVSV